MIAGDDGPTGPAHLRPACLPSQPFSKVVRGPPWPLPFSSPLGWLAERQRPSLVPSLPPTTYIIG